MTSSLGAATAREPSSRRSVSVVILAWNRRESVLAAIARIKTLAGCAPRVIVVDNASDDGTADAVREAHPDVTVAVQKTNLGFAGGVNRGLRIAHERGDDYAWLLNDDTAFDRDVLARLIDDAIAHPACGLVSPRIVDLDRDADQFANGVIDWDRSVMVHNLAPASLAAALDRGATPIVPGTALLVDLRVFQAIGGFDEGLFAYWEDTDYATRAARAGFGSRVADGAVIRHEQVVGRLKRPPHYAYYMIRNESLFWSTQSRARPLAPWRRRWLAASLVWVGECRDQRLDASADAAIDGIWHALRGRGGPRTALAPAPRLVRRLALMRPYLWAHVIRGDFAAIRARIARSRSSGD